MNSPRLIRTLLMLAAASGWTLGSSTLAETSVVPADSAMAQIEAGQQLHLLRPLTSVSDIQPNGWKMSAFSVTPATELAARIGSHPVRFSAVASSAGAKGDFIVTSRVPGETSQLGMWVYVAEGDNCATVGLQVGDAEGEQFLLKKDVEPIGWQWVEFDLTSEPLPKAWKQTDRNGHLDQPIEQVNVVWYAPAAGPTTLAVNTLFAVSTAQQAAGSSLAMPGHLEPDQAVSIPLIITNASDQPAEFAVESVLQRNPDLTPVQTPHPQYGTNHAWKKPVVTTVAGREIQQHTLTDPDPSSSWRSDWGAGDTEVVQVVDLGERRAINRIEFTSGDANWAWTLDVQGSQDGQTWTPAPGLTGIEVRKKWNEQSLPLSQRFEARYVKLRYHNNGESANSFSTFADLRVYDGIEDERWQLPNVGEPVVSEKQTVTIGPRSLAVVPALQCKSLNPGAFLLAVSVKSEHDAQVLAQPLYVMPRPISREQQAASPIGMNVSNPSLAPLLERLGVGWVRFENLKWRMVTRERGVYKFDGLLPWGVDHDAYVQQWADHGMKTLPYYFMSPMWASGLDKSVKHNAAYPPKDYNDFGDGVFQLVARYGDVAHDSPKLWTQDKKTGLGQLSVYELWNEPNLNDPNWGHWIGTLPEYYDMFRVGAEAAKRADPDALVANGGYAGISLGLVDQLRSYTYADGKCPLDFVDVLSVHTYTGASAPEMAVVDTNVNRSGNTRGSVTHEQRLRRLGAWRDQHKPGMEIWITETGYDTGGPRAVTEREQAAYSVRNALMMLEAGIDKVFIYREKGSGKALYAASGLLRNDSTLKPSYFSMATLIRQLDGATDICRLPHDDPSVYLYAWQRAGQWVVAAWSIAPSSAHPLALQLGSVTLTDTFGGSRAVEQASQITLTDMPIYLSSVQQPDVIDTLAQQSRDQYQAWLEDRQRLAALRTYLFDFGSTDHVGVIEVGVPRPFTPVGADDLYNKQAGYGFVDTPGNGNNDARWVKSPTHRDSVSVSSGQQFRIDVEPGRYQLTMQYRPKGPTGQCRIISKRGETLEVQTTREEPEVEVEIDVAGGSIMLEFQRSGTIAFATLVERP